jgi:hypothetical protein
MTDATGNPSQPFAGYLLFVTWRRGDNVATGHIETDYLVYGATEEEAREKMGAMMLNDALAELNARIQMRGKPGRPWWEAMQDESAQ